MGWLGDVGLGSSHAARWSLFLVARPITRPILEPLWQRDDEDQRFGAKRDQRNRSLSLSRRLSFYLERLKIAQRVTRLGGVTVGTATTKTIRSLHDKAAATNNKGTLFFSYI